MNANNAWGIGLLAILSLLALLIKPLRKAIGLLIVLLGFIACLTFWGAIVGIPMILVGGILLFI